MATAFPGHWKSSHKNILMSPPVSLIDQVRFCSFDPIAFSSHVTIGAHLSGESIDFNCLSLKLPSCVTLGKLFHLSVPPFPLLNSEDNDSLYCKGLLKCYDS